MKELIKATASLVVVVIAELIVDRAIGNVITEKAGAVVDAAKALKK